MREELLRMERVVCISGSKVSLDRFHLNIYKGEVVVVMGTHDAGQQMLVDLLSGGAQPDRGRILFEEEAISLSNMDEARAAGIYSVLQGSRLVPDLTVAENIFVIRRSRRHHGIISHRVMERQTKRILDSVGMEIAPDTPARHLTVADQHLIEITKAMTMGAKLIINDDLRIPYTHREMERLHRMVRQYVSQGVSFLIVTSHNDESSNIFSIADRVVVIRDGQNVGELRQSDYNPTLLTNLVVGREFHFAPRKRMDAHAGEVLRVSNLCGQGLYRASFSVHAGEIVGLLDLAGHANQEVVDILTGYAGEDSGTVLLGGQQVHFSGLGEAIAGGVGFVPALPVGLQLPDCMSAAENLSLILLRRKKHPPLLKLRKRSDFLLQDNLELLGLPGDAVDCPIHELPAAVRLRLLYLRWILGKCRLLICVKPSTALDVMLRDVAQSMLDRAAQSGMAVLVVSADPAEVASVCDRIAIFSGGQIKCILPRSEFIEADLSVYS
ncbi:MAG: Ribose transport system, ATP-binding protein RbsA [Oscillospiraceae bacterium]|nr:Ribose transport system, ATP-binding protein RbsA [Oscillospiraceae bacterium]